MSIQNELFNTREENDFNVIDVNVDSLDHRYIDDFKAAINSSLNSKKQVLMNLEAVDFMDSAGLGVILYGHRTCSQAGGQFSVCRAHGYVNKLFNLTGVNKAVKIFENEQDALNG